MLIYDPASDPNHFVFRLIKILFHAPTEEIEFDRYRILDFYLLFPSAIENFSVPRDISLAIKKSANTYKSKYNALYDKRLQFNAIFDLQRIATRYLVAAEILDKNKLDQSILSFSKEKLPSQLNLISQPLSDEMNVLETFILRDSFTIALLGPSGLKARSGLIEHKYDAI